MRIIKLQELFAANPITYAVRGTDEDNQYSLSCDEIVQIGEAFVYQVRLGSKIIQFPWNTVIITFAKDTADD